MDNLYRGGVGVVALGIDHTMLDKLITIFAEARETAAARARQEAEDNAEVGDER